MSIKYSLILQVVLFAYGSTSLLGAEPTKTASPMSAPNAAGIYWLAFSVMPGLDLEQKTLLKATSPSVVAPLPNEIVPLVSYYGLSLSELHRAYRVVPCDWQLDETAGPLMVMPHLSKAIDVSHAALLRARHRFASGETDAAISDVLAVLKLARDGGASPFIVSMYVDSVIEKAASEVLAANLTQLKPEQIHQLLVALSQLPASSDLATIIQADERLMCEWLERKINVEVDKLSDPQAGGLMLMEMLKPLFDQGGPGPSDDEAAEGQRQAELMKGLSVTDVRASLQLYRNDSAALHEMAELPMVERSERVKSLVATLSAARQMKTRDDAMRYISVTMMQFNWNDVFAREEQLLVRRQLLEQALRVQLDGANVLQEIYRRKVEYKQTATGFELRCLVGDKPVVLTVGGDK